MFSKKISLSASKQEFLFSDGKREVRFRPIARIDPQGKKILSVGDPSPHSFGDKLVDVFATAEGDQSLLLEALIRYGMREIFGRFSFRPAALTISINAEIRGELKGFAEAIFRQAANQSGAMSVEFVEAK